MHKSRRPGDTQDVICGFCVRDISWAGTTAVRTIASPITPSTPRTTRAREHSARLEVPIDTAAAVTMIGVIRGATIIAPMTVAVESVITP